MNEFVISLRLFFLCNCNGLQIPLFGPEAVLCHVLLPKPVYYKYPFWLAFSNYITSSLHLWALKCTLNFLYLGVQQITGRVRRQTTKTNLKIHIHHMQVHTHHKLFLHTTAGHCLCTVIQWHVYIGSRDDFILCVSLDFLVLCYL